jgi:fimbrial chaperone protein
MYGNRRAAFLFAFLVSTGALCAGRTDAAYLEISPVVVLLTPGQTTATIEVQNRGDAPAAIQARAFRWSQVGDDDPLTATDDIILSPPIFTVPQGASQTLRLLMRGPHIEGERTYRLLLDEVPPANAGKKEIVIALRASLPVIVAAGPPALAKLQWRAERDPGGQLLLTAANMGQAYDTVRAIDLTLADGSHPKVVPAGKNPYILPGAERHWIVKGAGTPAGPMSLSVTTEAGKSEQGVAVP